MEQVRKRNDFAGERTRSLPTSRWQSDEGTNFGKGVEFWQLSEKLNALRSSRGSVAEGKGDPKVKVVSASHEPAVVQNFHSEIQTVNHEDFEQLIRRPLPRQRIFHGEKLAERLQNHEETRTAPIDLADGSSLKRRNSLVIRRNRAKVNNSRYKQVNKLILNVNRSKGKAFKPCLSHLLLKAIKSCLLNLK